MASRKNGTNLNFSPEQRKRILAILEGAEVNPKTLEELKTGKRVYKRKNGRAYPDIITAKIRVPCLKDGAFATAVRRMANKCLLQQGLKLLGSDFTHIRVDKYYARFTYKNHRYIFPVPATIAQKIKDWDNDKEVEEFTAVLQAPISVTPVQKQKPRTEFVVKRDRKSVVGMRRSVRRYAGECLLEPNKAARTQQANRLRETGTAE